MMKLFSRRPKRSEVERELAKILARKVEMAKRFQSDYEAINELYEAKLAEVRKATGS